VKFESVTLNRSGNYDYQVTIWSDGVMRWDGNSATRAGAWQARLGREELAAWSDILRGLPPTSARKPGPLGSIIIDAPKGRQIHRLRADSTPAPVWRLAMLIDGISMHAAWMPFDVADEYDFTRFARGTMVILHDRGAQARALVIGADELLVLAGSTANTHSAHTLQDGYKRQRAEMLDDGTLELRDDALILTRHVMFSSPSAPACILAGHNLNGRQAWRDRLGTSWSQLHLNAV
jgi:hypothetical protein